MYEKLAKRLNRTRDSLNAGCYDLGINPELLDPLKMLVVACDNCGYWQAEKYMFTYDDGGDDSLYCKACVEVDNLHYE